MIDSRPPSIDYPAQYPFKQSLFGPSLPEPIKTFDFMALSKPNDDLFADTTMSFGEHLEELRTYLIRALFGLFIGFIIGLFVSKWVVKELKEPLRKALENYYKTTELKK